MRNKNKLQIILLGIIFALSIIVNYDFINDQGANEGIIEHRDETNLKNLKNSGYWITNFIHIDGNWSDTEGNYPWCSGDGSWNNPYTIENVTVDASTSPTGSGIFIDNSKNEYFIIRNCTVYNAGSGTHDAGIKLENTNNGTLSNNICSNNARIGIFLFNNCKNNTISGNTANNNILGIWLYTGCNNNTVSGNTANDNVQEGIYLLTDCDDNIISGNTANDSYHGIILNYLCNNNTILGNTANDNYLDGIYLFNNCHENTISGNTVNNNLDYGISIESNCDNNIIKGNIVFDNNVGIQLDADCSDNMLFYNYIFNNLNNNGYDSGSNHWNNSVIGNYWDDYTGIDADYDGIGDTPYNVPGGAGNKDNKPIMIYDDMFFKIPDDLTYEVGTVGHSITWIVMNPLLLPLTFNVYMDGTSVKTGHLFPGKNEIVISVNGLDSSIYGFTIEVPDGYGGVFTDGVWVTVTNTKPIFTATPNDFSYEVGETGNNLSWMFSDASTNDPTYTLTRNGLPLIIDDPCISGEAINISVDGLGAGSNCFTIEIDDGYGEAIMDCAWVTVTSEIIPNLLFVEIIDQSFSLEYFNITSSVYNESGQGIDSATIQMWWNGIDVSNNVVDLGNGLYFVSLEPIVVAPGEDPILLTMIISAEGFRDKSIETYIAVDPDTMNKDGEELSEFPLIVIIIASTLIAGGIGVAGITIFLLRKRSQLRVSN